LSTQKFLTVCEWSVYGALCLAILLLGVGRVEFGFWGLSMSAWSVSRTTLGFWLILKIIVVFRQGWPRISRAALLPFVPLASFFAIVTLSLLPDFRAAGDYRYLVFAFCHAVMVVDVFADAGRQRWLLLTLAVSPLVFVVRGFIDDPEVFNFALSYRFDFPLDHANTAGYLLAMSFPLAFYVARAEPGWRRWLATLSCLGQILALLLTYSRGAWLGWIAAMFFYGVATRQLKFLIVTLAVTATCVVALPSLRQRVLSVARPRIDPSLSDRLRLAEDAFRLGVDHPILGVGYGRGRLKSALRSRYQGTLSENSLVLHTHNVYIEIFAETGLLGLGTFLALIISTLWRLLHSALTRSAPQRFAGIAIAASWTAAAVAGLGDIPFYHHEPRVFFFTLFALAYLYCRGADTELSPKSLGG